MALPERVHGELKQRHIKLVNGEALAALEKGWLQYKEGLELQRKQTASSHAKVRRNFRRLSFGESPISFSLHSTTMASSSRKACILSIDGGGMRGIIPATVLCYLEESLQKKSGDKNARITDFFDIIAGTSIGGLLATMLCTNDGNGRPLFSAKEASRLITDEGKDYIFKSEKISHPRRQPQPLAKLWSLLAGRRQQAHNSIAAAAAAASSYFESLLKRHLVRGDRELTLRDTIRPLLIPCYDMSSAGAFLFSRADALRCESFNFRLAEVCLATTAIPGMCRAAKLTSVDGKTSVVGVDGGLAMNNPTAAAITHVIHNKEEFPHVQDVGDTLVLSLGTGLGEYKGYEYEEVKRWGALDWARPVARIVLDGLSDTVDHFMSIAFRNHSNNYVRIQVSGLGGGHRHENLSKLADAMLDQPCMEHVPFGGKRQLAVTNRERLDWFADRLVAEHHARASQPS